MIDTSEDTRSTCLGWPPMTRTIERLSFGTNNLHHASIKDSMAPSIHENHDSYRLHRGKPDGLVSVLNQDGFLMAEYNPFTGVIAWHRVVPANKRGSIERQLAANFPAVANAHSTSNKSRPRSKKR
jgi:hypothetical protein